MLAKGHDLPNLTLVAVVGIDEGLFSADFRAGEKLAQLLIQVAGRAGRAEKPGEVLLQTHHPEHPLLQTLIAGGYHAFAEGELAQREAAGFPPFAHMALLRAEAKHADAPMQFLHAARNAFAPFEKGGHGGFASAATRQAAKANPPRSPFYEGGSCGRRTSRPDARTDAEARRHASRAADSVGTQPPGAACRARCRDSGDCMRCPKRARCAGRWMSIRSTCTERYFGATFLRARLDADAAVFALTQSDWPRFCASNRPLASIRSLSLR